VERIGFFIGGNSMQRIFIIEDDKKIAQYLQEEIQKYGYEVQVATDFTKIMDQFNTFAPDIVLLDINLLSYDGFYWFRQIRLVCTCLVIFICGRVGDMDQVMALENGDDDFIQKPFGPEVVLAKIRSHLRRAYGEYAVQ